MDPERHHLGREEPLDHAQQRQVLPTLQTDDQVGPERLHLVVLERLPGDPGHEPGRVDDDEIGPELLGLFSWRAATPPTTGRR